MSSIINKKLSATSTEDSHLLGVGLKSVLIKNQGANDCLIEFDVAIDSDSYLLESGESLSIDSMFIRLFYKTNSGTTILYLIKSKT